MTRKKIRSRTLALALVLGIGHLIVCILDFTYPQGKKAMHSILALATLFLILTTTACEHTHPLADHDHQHTHDLPAHNHRHQHGTDLQALHEDLVGTYQLRTVQTTTVKSNDNRTYKNKRSIEIEEQAEEKVTDTIRLHITTDKFEIQPKQWPWPTWPSGEPDRRWHSIQTVRQVINTEPVHYYLIEPTNITFYPASALRYTKRYGLSYHVYYTWDSNGLLTLTRAYVNLDYRERYGSRQGETHTQITYIIVTKWQKVV